MFGLYRPSTATTSYMNGTKNRMLEAGSLSTYEGFGSMKPSELSDLCPGSLSLYCGMDVATDQAWWTQNVGVNAPLNALLHGLTTDSSDLNCYRKNIQGDKARLRAAPPTKTAQEHDSFERPRRCSLALRTVSTSQFADGGVHLVSRLICHIGGSHR